MDINELSTALSVGVGLSRKLQTMLDEHLTATNVHSTTSSVVALNKGLIATALSLVRLKAASDQIWSMADVKGLMAVLADSIALALDNVLATVDLPESVKRDLKHDVLAETTRLFVDNFDESQQQVTEDRRNGVTAVDTKLLTEKNNNEQ